MALNTTTIYLHILFKLDDPCECCMYCLVLVRISIRRLSKAFVLKSLKVDLEAVLFTSLSSDFTPCNVILNISYKIALCSQLLASKMGYTKIFFYFLFLVKNVFSTKKALYEKSEWDNLFVYILKNKRNLQNGKNGKTLI